jgi:hypothetical protein
MRLLKLIAYSLLGYVLYELFLGMTEGSESDSSGCCGESFGGSTRRDAGATTGGSGECRNVNTEDAGSGQASRAGGRGTVH